MKKQNKRFKYVKEQVKNYIFTEVNDDEFHTYFNNDIRDCKTYTELIFTLTYMVEVLANKILKRYNK